MVAELWMEAASCYHALLLLYELLVEQELSNFKLG